VKKNDFGFVGKIPLVCAICKGELLLTNVQVWITHTCRGIDLNLECMNCGEPNFYPVYEEPALDLKFLVSLGIRVGGNRDEKEG
jgi:hypothetical protein